MSPLSELPLQMKAGNLVYVGTTQNFNPLMATAADLVIAEAEKVVKVGEIAPRGSSYSCHVCGLYLFKITNNKTDYDKEGINQSKNEPVMTLITAEIL